MERLTIKNSDGTYSQPTHTTFEKMFYKLAEFEDFMEENGFESFEDLKKCFDIWNSEDDEAFLKDNDNMKLRVYRFAKNELKFYIQLTQTLSNRWQKLKEFVTENFNYFKNSYGIFDDIFADDYRKVLDKMQELEDGSDTNVDTK